MNMMWIWFTRKILENCVQIALLVSKIFFFEPLNFYVNYLVKIIKYLIIITLSVNSRVLNY